MDHFRYRSGLLKAEDAAIPAASCIGARCGLPLVLFLCFGRPS
jgi:hypothetical protein